MTIIIIVKTVQQRYNDISPSTNVIILLAYLLRSVFAQILIWNGLRRFQNYYKFNKTITGIKYKIYFKCFHIIWQFNPTQSANP